MHDWYDAEQRVERAQEFFAQQRWVEALEELRAAIAINPHNAAYHFNAGLTLDQIGRVDEAVDEYRQAMSIEPEDIDAIFRLGRGLGRLGRFRESIEMLERIEQLDAAWEPCYCGRIMPYVALGNHEKAEEMFYIARQYKDECPNCYFAIAQSLYERGLYDKALYCWFKTLDLDETYPEVHLNIARCFWQKGELERARGHYQKEWRQSPRCIDALVELGRLLLQMHRIEEAGEKFRRAIELAPEAPQAYIEFARWLLATDQLDAARNLLDRVRLSALDYPGVQMRLGEIAARQGKLAEARRFLRNELRLQPRQPQLLLDLANIMLDCGQRRLAVICLRRLTSFYPGRADGWQNLAVAQFMRRRWNEGIAASAKALECDPRRASAMYNLAIAFERCGEYEKAVAWVRSAAQIDAHDPALHRLGLRMRALIFLRGLGRGIAEFFRRRGR